MLPSAYWVSSKSQLKSEIAHFPFSCPFPRAKGCWSQQAIEKLHLTLIKMCKLMAATTRSLCDLCPVKTLKSCFNQFLPVFLHIFSQLHPGKAMQVVLLSPLCVSCVFHHVELLLQVNCIQFSCSRLSVFVMPSWPGDFNPNVSFFFFLIAKWRKFDSMNVVKISLWVWDLQSQNLHNAGQTSSACRVTAPI